MIVHLHVHSDYSILDGYATVDEIIHRVSELGQNAIALTDHGTLAGLIEFYIKAKSNDIKPILGCEFYYVDGEEFVKDNKRYHITVLAESYEGYQNLLKLSYYAYSEGFYYKPRINFRLLREYNNGLIVTTGCIQGLIPNLIINGMIDIAEKKIREFLDVFGDRYYIELSDHGLKKQEIVNRTLLEFSKKYGIKIIATNDSHYAYPEHAVAHDVMIGINTNANVDTTERLRLSDDNNNLLPQFYIKGYEEMASIRLFQEYPDALKNTVEVSDRCNVELPITSNLDLPIVNRVDDFYGFVRDSLIKRLGRELTQEEEDRLKYEIEVIERMGYKEYFLLVKEIVDLADELGVARGPARGSAGGSLVAYALDIVRINPLQHGLLFERFLNPERVSPPDIDIDFDASKRDWFINCLRERYGEHNLAYISTYGRMGVKMAIRDVGRFYKYPNERIDTFIKNGIPDKLNLTFEDVENPESNPKYKNYVSYLQNGFDKIVSLSKQLYGRIRQAGIHASGIVISKKPIYEVIPVIINRNSEDKFLVAQPEYEYCEQLGLVKIDILGLKTLSLISRVTNKLKSKLINLDLNKITYNDQKVFDLFRKGLTTGVFQFESEGIKSYLRRLLPDTLDDIVALNALYRPGPLNEIDKYIARKHGEEAVTYLDPRLEEILKETYGIIVYQEQIMNIARVIAKYTLAEADLLRRAIGKKIKEIIIENRNIFIERAVANNTDKNVAEQIFELIERFVDYGFNKSHAVGYAYLAYQTAYIKTYYPTEFFEALIDLYKDDKKYLADVYEECEILGVRVNAPRLNIATTTQTGYRELTLGLDVIHNVGEQTASELSKQHTHIRSINDLLALSNRRVLESLCWAGTIDHLVRERNNLEPKSITLFDVTQNNDKKSDKTKQIEDEIEQEVTHLGAVLSNKYRIKYESMIPTVISFWSKLRGYKDLQNYTDAQNRVHILCRPYQATIKKEKGLEYYEVKAYDKFGIFKEPFKCPKKFDIIKYLGKDIIISLTWLEEKQYFAIYNVREVLDFALEEGYVLKYYINISEIDEGVVKAIEKDLNSLREDIRVIIHFWDSNNEVVPIMANYHPLLDKFERCFIATN
jgi:DNA polymerase-3 subunit alpha